MPKIDTTSSVTPISAKDCTRFCQKEMYGNYHTRQGGKTVAVMGGAYLPNSSDAVQQECEGHEEEAPQHHFPPPHPRVVRL